MDDRAEWVYVVQYRPLAVAKIGRSTRAGIARRLQDIARGLPSHDYDVLCVMEASESELHERFAAYRTKGEWFRVGGALREWLCGHLGGEHFTLDNGRVVPGSGRADLVAANPEPPPPSTGDVQRLAIEALARLASGATEEWVRLYSASLLFGGSGAGQVLREIQERVQ